MDNDNGSLACVSEARLAIRYAKRLLLSHRNCTVAILCYYNAQDMLISDLMNGDVHRRYLKVCTLDSYQGKKAHYVILSTSAQQGTMTGFLTDMERACVATSRGKNRLIILGHDAVLKKSTLWRAILDYVVPVKGNTCSAEAVR